MRRFIRSRKWISMGAVLWVPQGCTSTGEGSAGAINLPTYRPGPEFLLGSILLIGLVIAGIVWVSD